MLEYGLQKGHDVSIFTTLVGMTQQGADKTCSLLRKYRDKVQIITIHLPDASNNMPGWRRTEEWDYVFRQFLLLYKDKVISRFIWMTIDKLNRIHPDVPANRLILNSPKFRPMSRAGNLDKSIVRTMEILSPVMCSRTSFYDRNVLLPNGDILLCCMDYGLKHILGNILEEEYNEIIERNPIHGLNSSYGIGRSICKKCSRAIKFNLDRNKNWIQRNSMKKSIKGLLVYCKKLVFKNKF
jgi:hypothetical protein